MNFSLSLFSALARAHEGREALPGQPVCRKGGVV